MQVLDQFSEAVLPAVNGNEIQGLFVSQALHDLAKLESRPARLTEIAYEWCSAIYANRENFEDLENLLLDCLELGFRHIDPSERRFPVRLTHTEHHRGLVDVVFKSQKSEAIADLLMALAADYSLAGQAGEMDSVRMGYLINLHNLGPFSPRLRQLVIRLVATTRYKGFESTGVELLNHLHVTVEEMHDPYGWTSLLFDVIRSSEGPRRLSDWYWECLVELTALGRTPKFGDADALKIAKSLIDAEEWGKLECWIGVVWMYSWLWRIPGEGLEPPTLLMLRHRPGATQRLEQRIEQWSQRYPRDMPEPLQQILTQAHEAAQQKVSP